MKQFVCLVVAFAVLGAIHPAGAGPISEYYITNGDSLSMKVVQGNSIVRSWTLRDNQYPTAVVDTVRAYGTYSNNVGSEYDLFGNFLGVNYPHRGDAGQSLDGTTDAVSYNWLVSFNDDGVWQFDRNWANPIRIFGLPTKPTGITYDLVSGHLWIARDTASVIEEYTLGGTLVSSFGYGSGRLGSLAYEPATDTLWGNVNGSDEIRQFSKAGVLLESVNIPGLAGNNWGGEFSIPEPGALSLLLLGSVALLRRR